MSVLSILQKPQMRKVIIEIDLDKWERLADTLGMYRPEFIKTLHHSLAESRRGRVRKISSLKDLEK